MYWTEERKGIARAFAIAPVVPIAIVSLLDLPAGLFIFIVGAPVAYACAAIIGIPLYIILNKFRLYGWPYFILGGSLCAIPGILLFSTQDAPLVYSLQSTSIFSLIGAIGGFSFWLLYVRKKFNSESAANLPGLILLAVTGAFLSYIYVLGEYNYIDGRTLSTKHPLVSQIDTVVNIEIDGQVVEARIPKGVPYRTNCKIGVVVWRELFSHKTVYSLSNYPDYPIAHHYWSLTKEAQEAISKSCD